MLEEKNGKLYTVGELAKLCGVTVRTLQYYDSESLLSPKQFSEGGRRLYGREDVIKLQQILFLKSFGFSLEEIRDRLMTAESAGEICILLEKQRDVMEGQLTKLQETVNFLSKVIDEVKQSGSLSTQKLVTIIEMMKAGNPYSFVLRYFDQKEMKALVNLYEESKQKGAELEWQERFDELISLHRQGADPEGEQGQELAEKWWTMVIKFTADDPDILKTLMYMGQDVDNWPAEAGELKEAAKVFMTKAMGKYLMDSGKMYGRS